LTKVGLTERADCNIMCTDDGNQNDFQYKNKQNDKQMESTIY